jgi:rubrerythrin
MEAMEAIEAIEIAIKIEEAGINFYTEAAEKVEDDAARKMFLNLAKDEQKHLLLFRSVRQSLLEKGEWPSVTALPIGKTPNYIFPTPEERERIEVPQQHQEILRKGMEIEEASIRFYTEQLDKSSSEEARQVYKFLVEQEKGHLALLRAEYDYLNRTGFWFDYQEFSLEAG